MKTNNQSDKGKTARKPYVKPHIEQVRLVPEEAVLVACRGIGKGGPDISPGCGATGGGQCVDSAT